MQAIRQSKLLTIFSSRTIERITVECFLRFLMLAVVLLLLLLSTYEWWLIWLVVVLVLVSLVVVAFVVLLAYVLAINYGYRIPYSLMPQPTRPGFDVVPGALLHLWPGVCMLHTNSPRLDVVATESNNIIMKNSNTMSLLLPSLALLTTALTTTTQSPTPAPAPLQLLLFSTLPPPWH